MENTFDLFPENNILSQIFTMDTLLKVTRIVIVLLIGLIAIGIIISIIKKISKKSLDTRTSNLVIRCTQYLGIALVIIMSLQAGGVNLTALLGAAGIVGIAVGFAAQTSVSNFISGFFLMSEKIFTTGDWIEVEGISGIVYSIDTLSVKLKTFDNRLIRIPNETLIKTNVINYTRFPVRRLNINIVVPHNSDIDFIENTLQSIAKENAYALRNPEPFFTVSKIADNGIELFFGVWFSQDDFGNGNKSIHKELNKRFVDEKIQFAHQAIVIYNQN